MKKILSFLIMGGIVGAYTPSFAAAVAGRLSCEEISAEISRISALDDATDDDAERLKDLRGQYRRSCQKAAGGRLNNSRTAQAIMASKRVDEVTATLVAPAEDVDDVDSFLEKKAENCRQLADSIAAKKAAAADSAEIEKMQAQYDADCVAPDDTAAAAPEIDPAELAAQNAELRAQGLCPNNTKPNRFGCCPGERFKDLSNMEFACCNEETDECLAPIAKE